MLNFLKRKKERPAADGEETDRQEALARQDDPLLAALDHVARRMGLPFSPGSALAGLPLRDGRLTVDLFPRAAARAGLAVRLVRRKPSKVPSMVVPFIVLFANGDAGVVTEKAQGRGRAKVVFPNVSDTARSVSLRQLDREGSGYVLYIAAEEETDAAGAEPATGRRKGHWLWSTVWKFWPSWTQVFIAAFAINLLGLAIPLFVMNVYDRVVPNFAESTLWALTAGVVLALVFDLLLKQLRAYVLDATGRRVDMAITARLFEQALGIRLVDRTGSSGAIASRVREFESVRDFFTSSSIVAITDFLFIGLFIGVLWMIVGQIAWVPTLAVPLVIILTLLAQAPLMRALESSQAQAARRHGVLVESLMGIETVKATGAEGFLQRRWEDAAAAGARSQSGARFWSSFVMNITGSVQQLVSVVVVAWGVFFIADGTITIGGLIAANILAGRLLAPLGNIAQTLARGQAAITAVRALTGMMELESDAAATGTRKVEAGAVAFRDVTFSYPGARQPSLDGVSFRIEPGERVGIVGRIGSGKTTIGRLLAGLYAAASGRIEIDGADVGQYAPAELRAGIGFVAQEPELFSGSVRDNIIIGRPLATDREIDEVVRIAGVDSFTHGHPLGLQMPVGERGRGLSGGQRQAVALARTLLRQPKLIFLDETSGAMDTGFEAALMQRLHAYRRGELGLIVCSHRNTFLGLVDRIMVVDQGKLIADGPKDDVLAKLSQRSGAANAAASPAQAAAPGTAGSAPEVSDAKAGPAARTAKRGSGTSPASTRKPAKKAGAGAAYSRQRKS